MTINKFIELKYALYKPPKEAPRMKIHEFIEQEKERLESFKLFWLQNSELDPTNFPNEMEVDEWDEQLKFANECFKS